MADGAKKTFLTKLTDVSSSDLEGVGVLRWEGNKCYKWVKFLNTTATVAGASGDVVAYTAEDGYDDSEVCNDRDDADTKALGAGVLQATVTGTLAVAYYCWIQIKGMATLSTALGGSAGDGDTLMAGTTDKAVTKFTNDDTTETNDGHPIGCAMDATAKTIICDFPF